MESDAEEEEILKERDAVPLRFHIPGARAQGGPPAAVIGIATATHRFGYVAKHG